MNPKTAWEEFSSLPPEAQQQVMDFIAFLQSRYKPSRFRRRTNSPKLAEEIFVGIWRDRDDLQDSSAWVRSLRKHEWQKS